MAIKAAGAEGRGGGGGGSGAGGWWCGAGEWDYVKETSKKLRQELQHAEKAKWVGGGEGGAGFGRVCVDKRSKHLVQELQQMMSSLCFVAGAVCRSLKKKLLAPASE